MKTKELIRQLQNADPSGEEEVSVGNIDIHFVEALPAYYDGHQEVIIKNDGMIKGAKFKNTGKKVMIRTISIEDLINDRLDIPVEVSDNLHKDWVIKTRKEAMEFWEEYLKTTPGTRFKDYYEEKIKSCRKMIEDGK